MSQSYPFGPREHHPYKVWCAQVRGMLGDPKPKVDCRVVATPDGISCGWCGGGNGCLACSAARERWDERFAEWEAWRLAIVADPGPGTHGAFADWLDEHGWPAEAEAARAAMTGEVPT